MPRNFCSQSEYSAFRSFPKESKSNLFSYPPEGFLFNDPEKPLKNRTKSGKMIPEAAVKPGNVIPFWIHNVLPSVHEKDPVVKVLIEEASALCLANFSEDSIKKISNRSGWKLSLLVGPKNIDDDSSQQDDALPVELYGWVIWRCRPDSELLSVAKIAVEDKHRSKGYGGLLVNWCKSKAIDVGKLRKVALVSLPDKIKFYQKFGFKKLSKVSRDVREEEEGDGIEDSFVEGQVHMEWKIPRRQTR